MHPEAFPPQFTPTGDLAPPAYGYTPNGDAINAQTNGRGDVMSPTLGSTPTGDQVLINSDPAYARGDTVVPYPQHPSFPRHSPQNLTERSMATEAEGTMVEEKARLEGLIGPTPENVAGIVKAAEVLRIEELSGNIKNTEALRRVVSQLTYDIYHKSTGDGSDGYYQLESWGLRLRPQAPPRLLMYIQYEVQAIRDLDTAGKLENKAVLRSRLLTLKHEVQLRMAKGEFKLHETELRDLPGTGLYLDGWINELDGVESDLRSRYDHLLIRPKNNR